MPGLMPSPSWKAELVHDVELSPTVRHLTFEIADPAGFRWAPGQHVELFAEDAPEKRFPYSIASAQRSDAPGRFELAVGRGEGNAAAIEALEVGGSVGLRAPRGVFVRAADHSVPAVLIGIGTGVAPLRAMIQGALSRRDASAPLVLLLGCRSERDLLWGEELMRLSGDERFEFRPTLSKPGPGWPGRSGYVQSHFGDLRELFPVAEFYVCGSNAMVEDATTRLAELGVPAHRLLRESY